MSRSHLPLSGTPWQWTPFFDAAGRFSALKTSTFIGAVVPAVWMAVEVNSGRWDLPSPFVPLIYHSGLWATYLLLLTLSVTPLRSISGWNGLAQLRRMLGVASCCYALLHVVAWGGLRFWDWEQLGAEMVIRPSLWLATIATIILIALSATSLDRAIRAMGVRRWKRLHRLGYGAALLAVVHFLMSPGSMQGTPFLVAGFLVWLMGWRVLDRYGRGRSAGALALLGAVAACSTLLLQPLWLATFQRELAYQTPWQTVMDNFDSRIWIDMGVPPVWVILVFGAAMAIVALPRSRQAGR